MWCSRAELRAHGLQREIKRGERVSRMLKSSPLRSWCVHPLQLSQHGIIYLLQQKKEEQSRLGEEEGDSLFFLQGGFFPKPGGPELNSFCCWGPSATCRSCTEASALQQLWETGAAPGAEKHPRPAGTQHSSNLSV